MFREIKKGDVEEGFKNSDHVLKVADVDSFLRLAEGAHVVIRLDPLLMVNLYGLIFYIDLGELDRNEVRRVLTALKDKMVSVKGVRRADSLSSFVEGVVKREER